MYYQYSLVSSISLYLLSVAEFEVRGPSQRTTSSSSPTNLVHIVDIVDTSGDISLSFSVQVRTFAPKPTLEHHHLCLIDQLACSYRSSSALWCNWVFGSIVSP